MTKKKQETLPIQLDERLTIKVFLGSPGDLAAERKAAKEVIDRLNVSYGRSHSVHIELLRWEDVSSGKGRPQGRINEELLKRADLFIGLIWKKWGTPTGEYSSGFEEEYAIAQNSENISDIQLFFRSLTKEEIASDSNDIKKVIEFKKRVINERNILFKEYKGVSDWKALLNEHLLSFCGIFLKRLENSKAPIAASKSKLQTPRSRSSKSKRKKSALLPLVLSEAKGKNESLIERHTRARLFVLSSALLYKSELQTEILPTHEINLLYRDHAKHKLIPAEEFLVLKTLVEDQYSVKPGWYWLKDISIIQDRKMLSFISHSQPETVGLNALKLILSIGRKVDPIDVQEHLSNTNEKIVVAALKIIGKWGNNDSINALSRIANERTGDIVKEANNAKLEILARGENIKLVREILAIEPEKRPDIHSYIVELLKEKNLEVLNLLKNLSADSDPRIRLLILEKFIHDFSIAELEKTLLDDSGPVIKVAFVELISRGKYPTISEIEAAFDKKRGTTILTGLHSKENLELDECKNSIIKLLISHLPLQEIVDDIRWGAKYSELYYEVLMESFYEDSYQIVETDITSNFERIRNSPEGHSYWQTLSLAEKREVAKLDAFHMTNYLNHISKGLSKARTEKKLSLARLILTRPLGFLRHDTLAQLIPIIAQFGDTSDFKTLWNTKDEVYGAEKKLSLISAIQFSSNQSETIQSLLDSNDDFSIHAILKFSKKSKDKGIILMVRSLLNNPNEKIRLLALAYLVDKYRNHELASLLEEKLKEETYYYNVICYLDRILYAPKDMRSHYKRQLTSLFNQE